MGLNFSDPDPNLVQLKTHSIRSHLVEPKPFNWVVSSGYGSGPRPTTIPKRAVSRGVPQITFFLSQLLLDLYQPVSEVVKFIEKWVHGTPSPILDWICISCILRLLGICWTLGSNLLQVLFLPEEALDFQHPQVSWASGAKLTSYSVCFFVREFLTTNTIHKLH